MPARAASWRRARRVAGWRRRRARATSVRLEQVAQQRRALAGVDLDGALLDGWLAPAVCAARRCRCGRVVQELLRERQHRRRERGGEEQVLAPRGQAARARAPSSSAKPSERSRSASSSTSASTWRAAARCAPTRSSSAPGRGHDDVGAAAQRHHLRVDRDAADGDDTSSAASAGSGRSVPMASADLRGELARGHEHEGAHLPAARGPGAQLRACRRGRTNAAVLPEPVRARGPHVAAPQHRGDGRALDRRRRVIAEAGHGTGERLREAEGSEGHGRLARVAREGAERLPRPGIQWHPDGQALGASREGLAWSGVL